MFPAQDLLEAHIKTHNQKYKCQICKAAFSKMRDLTDHARMHSGHKLVKCKICDKDFTEKGLRQHTERFHKVELDSCKPMKKRELRESHREENHHHPQQPPQPQPPDDGATISIAT